MKIFKAFKSIIQHITPFMPGDETKLRRACMEGDLNTIKNLFENKKLRYLTIDVDSLVRDTCSDGHLNVVEYLLTSPDTKEFHHINWTKSLETASHRGKVDIVDFFLTSPKYESCINEDIVNKYVLKPACELLEFDVVNYIIDSPKFSKMVDLHFEHDLLFKQAFNNQKTELLQHLIFDLKLTERADIIYFLYDDNINKQGSEYSMNVKNMFKIRDLNEKLDSELSVKPENKQETKRLKI
jgi:hypothetical protein